MGQLTCDRKYKECLHNAESLNGLFVNDGDEVGGGEDLSSILHKAKRNTNTEFQQFEQSDKYVQDNGE